MSDTFLRALNSRGFSFLVAFICHDLLVAAYYFQYVEGMEPCPLCIFQRVMVFFVGIIFLAKALHGPQLSSKFQWLYYSLSSIFAGLGAFIAGRHVYLKSLPEDQVPACGPALDYLMEALPFLEVIQEVLHGSGQCAKGDWTLMGLSMPGWMLVIFSGFLLLSLFGLYTRWTQRNA
ncbi:disulfide bond formation protein B [Pleionea sp. CnH1-48]|uniref:disulfide bond formation protein B n=1 Tax=Pleionea sp. CnH1-48 TaxID=2954494 RepID=UPI002097AC62|nr:disulfide bond formation protein B [Pleionea sp. CnH1-48]MCO7226215.1 disulfide bond formation protein B [Pleionea sp. CnH1-48]